MTKKKVDSHDRLLTDAIKAAEAYRKEALTHKLFADIFEDMAFNSLCEVQRLRGILRGITWGVALGMIGLVIWAWVW